MILPPVSSEYDASSQAVINEGLIEADDQNFKLDQDNFLKTGWSRYSWNYQRWW